jgi:RNA polymerase sigma-70 factor (ECF subfamily)
LFLSVVQLGPGRDELPDAALMTQLRDRNSGALETLYDRYSRPVYSLVLRISQQATAAEEIVQDVFLHLWRHADRYDASRGPLEPWLFTMARNRALDFLRLKSEKQRRREEAYEADPPPSGTAPEQPAELRIDQERRAARVRALMAELPETQRRAIELAFFDGLTHSEISAALGEPLGTIKSWIRGGLSRLRETLEKDEALS